LPVLTIINFKNPYNFNYSTFRLYLSSTPFLLFFFSELIPSSNFLSVYLLLFFTNNLFLLFSLPQQFSVSQPLCSLCISAARATLNPRKKMQLSSYPKMMCDQKKSEANLLQSCRLRFM
jgi:hypothetical protein